jgi:hypothetical protein
VLTLRSTGVNDHTMWLDDAVDIAMIAVRTKRAVALEDWR